MAVEYGYGKKGLGLSVYGLGFSLWACFLRHAGALAIGELPSSFADRHASGLEGWGLLVWVYNTNPQTRPGYSDSSDSSESVGTSSEPNWVSSWIPWGFSIFCNMTQTWTLGEDLRRMVREK